VLIALPALISLIRHGRSSPPCTPNLSFFFPLSYPSSAGPSQQSPLQDMSPCLWNESCLKLAVRHFCFPKWIVRSFLADRVLYVFAHSRFPVCPAPLFVFKFVSPQAAACLPPAKAAVALGGEFGCFFLF